MTKKLELRPYQNNSITMVREAMRRGNKRILYVLATGGGKTLIASEIIAMARSLGKRVAFVCNRIQLINQTREKLNQHGIPHGVIQGNNTLEPWRDVLVASIQTVAKRGLPEVDLLIFDEAHCTGSSESYWPLMEGKYCIGLTATPWAKAMGKYHKNLNGPLWETTVVGAMMSDLIAQDYLVSAEFWAPAVPDLRGVKTVAGDYDETQLGEVMDKPKLTGDIVQHWLKLAFDSQTLCFTVNIAHSQHLVSEFCDAGVNAVHVDYKMSIEDKEEIYRRFRAGEIRVLSNCALLSEGADFPNCTTMILARPTKSKIRYVQMVGRILRPYPGKQAKVLDHSGTCLRLGLPWDIPVGKLDDGKPKKSKGEGEEKVYIAKPCPKCHFIKPPKTPTCPQCGFKATKPCDLENDEGELVPMTKGTVTPAMAAIQSLGKQQVYSELLYICHTKGYKPGWTSNQYRDIFGVWPRGLEEIQIAPGPNVLSWLRHKQIRYIKGKQRGSNP